MEKNSPLSDDPRIPQQEAADENGDWDFSADLERVSERFGGNAQSKKIKGAILVSIASKEEKPLFDRERRVEIATRRIVVMLSVSTPNKGQKGADLTIFGNNHADKIDEATLEVVFTCMREASVFRTMSKEVWQSVETREHCKKI
jgi:hypothetical protein